MPLCCRWACIAATCLALGQVGAVPINPRSDDEVIERLPTLARISNSNDPQVALREASNLLDASREQGDPRFAGRALARLARWENDPAAPPQIGVMLASIEQFLHRFDAATRRLEAIVRRDPARAQAWLTLATLHRLAGRYDASDAACDKVVALRAQPYGDGCLAENRALRGSIEPARRELTALLAGAREPSIRAWLATTLAELEQRAGRVEASEAAWRVALQGGPDTYAALGYADLLLAAQRPADALEVLRKEAATDSVLLRRAIAAKRAARPDAPALRKELRERFDLADQRPENGGHDRERALMSLDVEGNVGVALKAAQRNVKLQREPIDVLLLARCAAAAGDTGALAEARRLAADQGLHDARLDAL